VASRYAQLLHAVRQHWQRATSAAGAVLSTTDGRWAMVSTMATVLIAGSIAWLAAGTAPHYGDQKTFAERTRSLMPYDLFARLASQGVAPHASYAAFGPSASIVSDNASPDSDFSMDGALSAEQAEDNDTPSDTRTVTLDSGDTLVGALTDAGVSAADANSAVLAMAKVFSPRGIRAGQSFDLTFEPAPAAPMARITYSPPQSAAADDNTDTDSGDADSNDDSPGKLLQISFSPTVDQDITISRNADGDFTAQATQKTLVARYHRAGATIGSSLYLAAMQAGIPADVVVEMIHMFSYEVDFQRDIQPGDKFEVYYDYYYTPNGQAAKEGNIQYATMKLSDRTVTLYRYQPKDGGPAEYFDAKGQSTKAMLMKTPVDGARISSGFGMRFHPVLGYTRMHKGVDFAVPVGTPVMAAGSGTVKFEGPSNGYGNFMLINHGNGYSTAYGHLSRFAPGIHNGSRVRQGQIVAYSGNTGLTTGPHLHYEIRIDNVQVNPLTVKVAGGRKLQGAELRQFLAQRLSTDSQMASLPLETKLADNNSGLRAGRD
jgi:murein DD-endopeptidase MepM/ murein hydrolase activator NlpD